MVNHVLELFPGAKPATAEVDICKSIELVNVHLMGSLVRAQDSGGIARIVDAAEVLDGKVEQGRYMIWVGYVGGMGDDFCFGERLVDDRLGLFKPGRRDVGYDDTGTAFTGETRCYCSADALEGGGIRVEFCIIAMRCYIPEAAPVMRATPG